VLPQQQEIVDTITALEVNRNGKRVL